jgi:hypothetical protein
MFQSNSHPKWLLNAMIYTKTILLHILYTFYVSCMLLAFRARARALFLHNFNDMKNMLLKN